MFAGGSWADNSFYKISRGTIINASSSLTSLLDFITNIRLNLDYQSPQDVLDMIHGQEQYDSIQNFNITHVQDAMLKAFDNNSSFYFNLFDEGYCTFISFANIENVSEYK